MGKKQVTLKQISSNKRVVIEPDRMPNYITKPPKFSCPVSPDILWHHNLIYSSCPLASNQRDMGVCADCTLKGDGKRKVKGKKSNAPQVFAKQKIEKRHKESIPNIGKTYTSE